jgi:hypothetical protein
MHQPAKVIPLVKTPKPDAIAQADGDSLPDVEIVCDQESLPPCRLQHEALVP